MVRHSEDTQMQDYKPLPWFPWFPNDWTARMVRQGLSLTAEGILVELLGMCWTERTIPADKTALASILRGYNGPAIDEVMHLFCPSPGEPGRLYCPELEGVRQQQVLKHRKQTESGKRGALKRWNKTP